VRIVIDLQVCQSELVDGGVRAAALQIAHGLIDLAVGHDVRILLADRAPHMISRLRRDFPALDDAGKIAVVCELGGARVPRGRRLPLAAAKLIRESVIRDLEPDWIITPAGYVDPGDVVVCSVGHLACTAPTVMLWMQAAIRPGDAIAMADDPRPRVGASDIAAAAAIYVESATMAAALQRAGAPAERIRNVSRPFLRDPRTLAGTILAGCASATGRSGVTVFDVDIATRPRCRLAFVSPMPPEHSGVATYNARLLPALAQFYDIELVTDQPVVDLPPSAEATPLRSIGWFVDHRDDYDRVLYHMGNSPFHADIPDLVRDFPGTVVMHDVYIGDLVSWFDGQPGTRGMLHRYLLDDHGYGAASMPRGGAAHADITRRYACNARVLDEANGIIVHSDFAAGLVGQRFHRYLEPPVACATLCREVEAGIDRAAARRRLAIGADEFVVSSFGFINHIKLLHELVDAWSATPMAAAAGSRLLIVGHGHADRYHRELKERIAQSMGAAQITITGYVDDATMADYLAATDVAVQLRSESRGETSGAALDCLAHGLPLVTNGCGAMAELPASAAVRIESTLVTAELTTVLQRLYDDPELRARLSREARTYIVDHHAPAHVAMLYARAIERFAADGPRTRYSETVTALAEVADAGVNGDSAIPAIARSFAANLRLPGPARLFVDVTPLVEVDLRTGIERVARAVLQHLIDAPPPGMQIEPVRFTDGRFVLARCFMSQWLGLPPEDADLEVEPRGGDIFLGLTWSPVAIPLAHEALRTYRDRGVRIAIVVYDLLPQQHSEWFPYGIAQQHLGWLITAAALADRLICISRDVAGELAMWLDQFGPERVLPLRIAHFPLGCDIEKSMSTNGAHEAADAVLTAMAARRTFLMVGTVEPRKGHRQAIEAFSELWRDDIDVGLVIVGKRGWMTEDIEAMIAAHPEAGRRLLRVERASDEFLAMLYRHCVALLAASHGEGFGLPIVEAARHGIPVIARDLPVFREVAGDGAFYFHGPAARDLADAIINWLDLASRDKLPNGALIHCREWAESTNLLMDAVAGHADCTTWLPVTARTMDPLAVEPLQCVVDFSRDDWPPVLATVNGVSVAEVWGRWSDAKIAPSVLLEFCRPLPRHSTLSLTARAFGANCGNEFRIRIGDAHYLWRIGESDSTVDIDIVTDGSQYTIEITPPMPTSPMEAGVSGDGRLLGIGLMRLELH